MIDLETLLLDEFQDVDKTSCDEDEERDKKGERHTGWILQLSCSEFLAKQYSPMGIPVCCKKVMMNRWFAIDVLSFLKMHIDAAQCRNRVTK